MSPEINGNPPSVTKRKKKRDKKAPANGFDLNLPNCNYFPMNVSIPDVSTYYSFMNCSNPSEPMSLPIYCSNYNCQPPPPQAPDFKYGGRPKRPPPVSSSFTAHSNCESNEYLSLPVANVDQNLDGDKRRFSDPGLPNESDSSTNNSFDDRVIHKLTQQVNSLKENNRKLSREVMELRIELNVLKQQHGSRHWDREYEPGMLADVIREVRDAARVREDALLARVRHLIEEKQLSLSHMHLVLEKNKNNDRIAKLEEQMKVLNVCNTRSEDGTSTTASVNEDGINSARQVFELEREALELRRELQDTRAKKEESEQKFMQLDKKLSDLLRHAASASDVSEDGKTTSIECLSAITSVSSAASQAAPPRVTLSGPVTDL